MQVRKGLEIYAGWDINDARAFCKKNNFTKEMVKVVNREGQIIVIARKGFVWG